MRLLLAAMQCEKGTLAANLDAHLAVVARAYDAGVDLVVFPEMSLTGSVDPLRHPERTIPIDHDAVVTLAAGSRRWQTSILCAESAVDHTWDANAAAGATLHLLTAAPGLTGRRTDPDGWRDGLRWWKSAGLADARRQVRRLGAWVGIATQAGSTVDEDFPGVAALVDPTGAVVARLPDERPGGGSRRAAGWSPAKTTWPPLAASCTRSSGATTS